MIWTMTPTPISTYPPGRLLDDRTIGDFLPTTNVWEWCQDWSDDGYYAKSPTDDPTGPVTGSDRVFRGGSWGGPAWGCASAERNGVDLRYSSHYVGLRVSLVPADK